MLKELPIPIIAYIEANNRHDIDAQLAPFAEDAIVTDEDQTLRGLAAIRAWIAQSQEAYNASLEPTGSIEEDGEVVVTNIVSGTFDGSPITLRFFFTLTGDKIAALTIRA